MFHKVQERYWITIKKQERILPSTVVNAELAEKVAKIEEEWIIIGRQHYASRTKISRESHCRSVASVEFYNPLSI